MPKEFAPAVTTTASWLRRIDASKKEILITSFYWTLTGGNPALGGQEGQAVYDALVSAANRGVKIRIVQSLPSRSMPDNDTAVLASSSLAEVRSLNMSQLMGGGILHSKFWVFDDHALWIGSANMDWRSLTQVKELGTEVVNCPELADDLRKLFETNWHAAHDTALPKHWSTDLDTSINAATPATIPLNASPAATFFSMSPKPFCAAGRTFDLDALVGTILSATQTVSIEVMDYLPATAFQRKNVFWPDIDDAMRRAAFDNGVHVRFLVGNWSHSDPVMFDFLRSLKAFSPTCRHGSIEVKLFNVPADPAGDEPYTRVNHAKFMVTEDTAFVTTSNWEADYYIDTGGASFNCKQPAFAQSLQAVFDRDWNSEFAVPL